MNSRLKLIQATFLFRDILRILNIRKSIIVSLVIAFGVLATLEMLEPLVSSVTRQSRQERAAWWWREIARSWSECHP